MFKVQAPSTTSIVHKTPSQIINFNEFRRYNQDIRGVRDKNAISVRKNAFLMDGAGWR